MHRDIEILRAAPGDPKVEISLQYGFAARGAAHAWIYDKNGDNPSDANLDYEVDASGAQKFALPVDAQTVKGEKRFVYVVAHVTSQSTPPAPVRAIASAIQGGQPLGVPMAMNATVTPDQQVAEFEFTFQFG